MKFSRRERGITALVAALLLLALLAEGNSSVVLFVTLALIFVMLTASWNFLAGYAGQLSLGTAGFFGVGAYFYVIALKWYSIPSILALVVGASVAAGLSALVAVPLFRLRLDVFAIGTLGLAEILGVIFNNWEAVGASVGMSIIEVAYNPYTTYHLTWICSVLTMASIALILRSKFGKGLCAIRDDEDAAASLGVPVLKYKVMAFGISSFIVGTAGGLYAAYNYLVNPGFFDVLWTAEVLLITMVGGLATLDGPVIMSIVYVFLLYYVLSAYPILNNFIYAGLLITVVILFPGGIVSMYRKEKRPWWLRFNQRNRKSPQN